MAQAHCLLQLLPMDPADVGDAGTRTSRVLLLLLLQPLLLPLVGLLEGKTSRLAKHQLPQQQQGREAAEGLGAATGLSVAARAEA
jgi:hypothetical protein